jgi:hypothetical protein
MFERLIDHALKVLSKTDKTSDENSLAEYVLISTMSSMQRDTLTQLVTNGPVADKETISEESCLELIAWGLASRIIVKGEQGYTAANEQGYSVSQALQT